MPKGLKILTLILLAVSIVWLHEGHAAADTTGFFSFPQTLSQKHHVLTTASPGSTSFNLSEVYLAGEYYDRSQLAQGEEDFEKALMYLGKAAYHFRLGDDWQSYARCFLQTARCYLGQSKNPQAVETLQEALDIIDVKFLTTNIVHADIHLEMGIALLRQGRKVQSIGHFAEAIALRMELVGDSDPQLANAYNKLGVSYYMTGKFDRALEAYRTALGIADRADVEPVIIAEICNNLGIVLKINGDLVESLDYYQRSMELKESHLAADDPNLARTYNNLGNLYRVMGKSDLAMFYYQKAESIFKVKLGPHDLLVGKLYSNEGIIYTRYGDYSKALQYFNQALTIFDNEEAYYEEIASAYNNMGNVYFFQENYEKALNCYTLSASARENNVSLFKSRSYSNIALCYNELGQYENARQYHQLSINCLKELYGINHYLLAAEYQNFGTFHVKLGELSKGLELYLHAYKIFKHNYGEKHPVVAECLSSVGNIYALEQNYYTALGYYQQALYSGADEFSGKYNIYSNPDVNQRILSKTQYLSILHKKALAFKDFYTSITKDPKDIQMSLKTFELAFELMDHIRIGHLTQESKLDLSKSQRQLFRDAIRTAYDTYLETGDPSYQSTAFQFAERGKAAMLYDFIRENDAKHYAHIPDSLLQAEHKIKEDIVLYQRLIDEEKMKVESDRDKPMLAHWEDKLFDLQEKQDELVGYLNVQYPKYYQYKYTNRIYTVDEIQSSLGEKDALVEYFLDNDILYTFYIAKDKLKVSENRIDSVFYRYVDALPNNQGLDDILNDANVTYANYLEASFNLYNLLLKPFERDFTGKNLIIIPDGILGYVSFESLLTSEASPITIDYKSLPYLLKTHTINYGYSSTLYLNSLRDKRSGHARENLLAFAPVYFDKERLENGELNSGSFRTRGESLMDLPATLQEVKSIRKILGGDVFLNELATVGRFKEMASDYRILHIATHSIVDNINPHRSRLVFSPVTEEQDGACLRYNDLFNLDLHADMAVLSACNTGYGQNSEGEGIIALSRGFMYSGVPSLVISLWSVEDESTALIMKNFYKYIKEGFSKDEALRRSKLDFLSTSNSIYSSPHFWSGFINIGNNEPLEFADPDFPSFWLILVFIIPLSLLAFFYRLRKIKPA